MQQPADIHKLVEHLFRHEAGKMVSVLTAIFGAENMHLAEDVVQDSLVEAINNWTYKGLPNNPPAWLFTTAKNKALNIFNREKYKKKYAADIAHSHGSSSENEDIDNYFSERKIADSQLRMIFTCCHPSISPDSQIALTLKTLCGFSIKEIAKGFLTTEENIHKRLVRARKKIRDEKIELEIPTGSDLANRLHVVLETIYLLFNEGYSASAGVDLIRFEICEEAIRLAEIIIGTPHIKDKTDAYALLALMQLNATRFKARQDAAGNIITMDEQDRRLWDLKLMEKGFINLDKSAAEQQISRYHILAGISAYHCATINNNPADWEGILALYDKLILIDNTPLVLLNRAVALSKVKGPSEALVELDKIKSIPFIASYHHFYSTQAFLLAEMKQYTDAAQAFKKAIEMAPLPSEKVLLNRKLEACLENFS